MDRYSTPLLRVAQDLLGTPAWAEEVVQETWLAVLEGIDRFEERASLKTWVFRILVNRARTRATREARTLPFSSLGVADEPVVPAERFQSDTRWSGHWAKPPPSLAAVPEERLLSRELRRRLVEALETLPEAQRVVVVLRDVVGCGSDEVCDLLDLTIGNQRVLLHRGRAKLRTALEQYVEESP